MTRFEGRMESPWSRAFSFALLGAGVGFAGGLGLTLSTWLVAGRFEAGIILALALGGFVGGLLIGLVAREGVGGLVERATGGTRGRSKKEYSQAQATAARGAYAEAVDLYAADADDNPDDPEPLIRGARILRDHLHHHEDAAAWLRRAARIDPLREEAEITIARELVELYDGPLGRPQEALPELARLVDKYQGTRAGDWARTRLARIRAVVWEEVKGPGD